MPLSKTTALAAGVLLLISGCSPSIAPAQTAKPHGYVAGAAELGEPQLTLATIDRDGELSLLNLLDESRVAVAELDDVADVSTDGRFVFASAPGTVTIVDTGVWTVDHEDHSHYYRAKPAVVGTVLGGGTGVPVVTGGGSVTAVVFGDATPNAETVLLDTAALGTGEIVETARIRADLVAPIGQATLVAARGLVTVLDQPGTEMACASPHGAIATRVGVVIGCDEGAVLATLVDETVTFEAVPYPAAVAESQRATEFRARPARPTVAALAGSTGFWLLDTRERAWSRLATDVPLVRVAAADDGDARVVALANDGRILTLDGVTGATLSTTAPLLAASVADPVMLAGVELTVDANRAYVNAPAEGMVYEIDYADGSRVAREFAVEAGPLHFVETGRVS